MACEWMRSSATPTSCSVASRPPSRSDAARRRQDGGIRSPVVTSRAQTHRHLSTGRQRAFLLPWRAPLGAHAQPPRKQPLTSPPARVGLAGIALATDSFREQSRGPEGGTNGSLALARKNARKAKVAVGFHEGNASTMPFESERFDFVMCTSSFKNFSEPHALNETHRVLRPGGRVWSSDLRHAASRARGANRDPESGPKR
jgi:hypothetical protein